MKQHALTGIRQKNLADLLRRMTFAPPRTRQALAEATGLSQMTMTNLVDILKAQQVLQLRPAERLGRDGPAQGRKAELISLSGASKAWLVADLSGLHFTVTLLGFDAQPLLELREEQDGEYLPRLEAFLRGTRDPIAAALEGRELTGIAVVTPGPYDPETDTVTNQRLPQLNEIRIKALFRRCFGEIPCEVDEDVKFAVRAFSELTASGSCEVLYYLYIGEGVGGAAVHGGRMLRGLNASAGDAGHLLRGGTAYEELLNTAAFLRRLAPGQAPPENVREALLCAAEEPVRYDEALTETAAVAAQMLHAVLWLLDPTHIIIDCEYAQPRGDGFAQAVREALGRLFAGDGRALPELSVPVPGTGSVRRGAVFALQSAWVERILA